MRKFTCSCGNLLFAAPLTSTKEQIIKELEFWNQIQCTKCEKWHKAKVVVEKQFTQDSVN